MSIIKAIENAIARANAKKWEFVYFLVDIHGTVFVPSYLAKENYEFYPYAKQVLQLLSAGGSTKLILWTSTGKEYIKEYLDVFERNHIYFDYVNENPEVTRQDTDPLSLDLSEKFYFNIGIDDKFGFDPETDWKEIFDYIMKPL